MSARLTTLAATATPYNPTGPLSLAQQTTAASNQPTRTNMTPRTFGHRTPTQPCLPKNQATKAGASWQQQRQPTCRHRYKHPLLRQLLQCNRQARAARCHGSHVGTLHHGDPTHRAPCAVLLLCHDAVLVRLPRARASAVVHADLTHGRNREPAKRNIQNKAQAPCEYWRR